jgi:hypothetical protein
VDFSTGSGMLTSFNSFFVRRSDLGLFGLLFLGFLSKSKHHISHG